jgi:hypothetical protein
MKTGLQRGPWGLWQRSQLMKGDCRANPILLSSATKIVYSLGLGDSLVGVSHECDYPPEVRTKPVVSTSDLACTLPQRMSQRFLPFS